MIRDNIKLSDRLMMSVNMVTKGYSVADVGCDHAHTCIYLVKKGIAPRCVAMDVRKGPLSHADANIRLYGLEGCITTRLSDGLDGLAEGETDAVIISGIGGTLMVQILEKGLNKAAAAKELILQPQSDIGMVRRFLRENGFVIVSEAMVKEAGKFYNAMKAVPCGSKVCEKNADEEVFDEFGRLLLEGKDPVLSEFLQVMQQKTERVLGRIKEEGSEESVEKKAFFENYGRLIEKAELFYTVKTEKIK